MFHSCTIIDIYAGVAQSAEQLICNQQVAGSSPITSSKERFPSGQRGQTVNLLAQPSEVRFLPSPPLKIGTQRASPGDRAVESEELRAKGRR